MTEIAVRAENLGKQYRIAAVRRRPNTLRDAVAGSVRSAAGGLAARLRGARGEGDALEAAHASQIAAAEPSREP